MKRIIVGVTLLMIGSAFAQYNLKTIIFGEGGKRITSGSYISELTFGQQIASNVLTGSNYLVILGFWHPPYGGGVGIKEKNLSQALMVSPVFSFSQCYPNPFKNKTTIRYSIPKETKVRLQVLNTAGRVIRTLINGMQKPGYYNVIWDLRNVSSSQLPPGVYFCRLEADEFTAIKKMVKIE